MVSGEGGVCMPRLRFKNYRFSEKAFVYFIYLFLFVFGFICSFPFINILARSFSPEFYIQQGQVWFWPIRFTLNAYFKIFQAMGIISGFKNSIYVTGMPLFCTASTILSASAWGTRTSLAPWPISSGL